MSVTLHTDLGNLKIELFCESCPKACENFLALCASDYYNGCLFHRNIKGFIVQCGDPSGTGKGGTSIWGKKFEDEFKEQLKHNARGTVSMASNGPNTNGSQFFIAYAAQPHLDLKYTIFGKENVCRTKSIESIDIILTEDEGEEGDDANLEIDSFERALMENEIDSNMYEGETNIDYQHLSNDIDNEE